MSTNSDRLAARRQEILTAAGNVFAARGYAAATMEEVAVEAGISKGSIYNYFENKYDLFTSVFTAAITDSETEVDRLLGESLPARAKLEGMLDEWYSKLSYYQRIGRLVLEFWVTAARQEADGGLASWFSQMYVRWRDRVAKVIAEGAESGEFEIEGTPQTAAALILAELDGIMVQMIVGMHSDADEEFFAALKRAILSALSAGSPSEATDSQ